MFLSRVNSTDSLFLPNITNREHNKIGKRFTWRKQYMCMYNFFIIFIYNNRVIQSQGERILNIHVGKFQFVLITKANKWLEDLFEYFQNHAASLKCTRRRDNSESRDRGAGRTRDDAETRF